MKQYEYTTIYVSRDTLDGHLNDMGRQGWRLCDLEFYTGAMTKSYMMRELSAPIPPSAPTEEQIEAAAREIYDEESARPTFGLSETQIATILRKHLLNRTHGGKGT